jgi:uncharacterized protein (DUF1697 family)
MRASEPAAETLSEERSDESNGDLLFASGPHSPAHGKYVKAALHRYTLLNMPAVICLLRGVNLGGHKKISMEALRNICVSLKHRNPQTYIQSGNVVFASTEADLAKISARLEAAIEKRCGFQTKAVLRTADELRGILARNPFATRAGINPSKLIVFFLPEAPGAETLSRVTAINVGPEEICPSGREIYIYFPDGMGQSKLPAALDRALKMPATARNWNTVNKLATMAEAL